MGFPTKHDKFCRFMKLEDLYTRESPDNVDVNYFLESLGGDSASVMRRAGLSHLAGKKLKYSPWAACCRYFELAAQESGDPYFGINFALNAPAEHTAGGPMVFLGSIASNLRHFLDIAVEYQKTHTNAIYYKYVEDEAAKELLGYIDMHPLSPPCRQMCENILASIAMLGWRYLPGFALKRVTFQYKEPDDLSAYEAVFKCPVEFNAPRNMFVASSDLLTISQSPLSLKLLTPVLTRYLKRHIDKNPLAKTTISNTVMEVLPSVIGVNNSDMKTVAHALNLHPKKLQRLLKDEGTSYSVVLEEVRKNMAKRFLIETEMPIETIAKMLDYSSSPPFSLAMNRWYDKSPRAYRASQRA